MGNKPHGCGKKLAPTCWRGNRKRKQTEKKTWEHTAHADAEELLPNLDRIEEEKSPMSTLGVSALENWLWEAACAIRGPVDAPKFKDYILPLIFLKRLSDVLEDEI